MKHEGRFMKMRRNMLKVTVCVVLVLSMIATTFIYNDISLRTNAETNTNISEAQITEELNSKRGEFVKQFAMSDGSFTAVTYAMPVHYKKNGEWKEINATLKKSRDKKKYYTKKTDLKIKLSKKYNNKSVVSLKRSSYKLSWALQGKKVKTVYAKVKNPVKNYVTDVLNHSQLQYKKIMKNMDVIYDIFPEKIQEVINIKKKQKYEKFSFKMSNKKLQVKVKNKKVVFKNSKGKKKYTRLKTVLTDANGVSTANVKLSYDKKKGVLTLKPNKKWWNDKKRKFPVEIRTSYITDKFNKDVKAGGAYAGMPTANVTYDKSLILQANKCIGFTKISTLAELGQSNVYIRDAWLHIKNEKTLKLGKGKTFDVGIHKVKENWNANKLSYNNRPSYELIPTTTISLQKKGKYQCDVTDIVKAWYNGEKNYGVALVADNSNRAYQAKLDRNPYFVIHYEKVGFDGAQEIKENEELTRTVVTAGQENYYYFDTEPNIAYELYSTSKMDTQAVLYDSEKNRLVYDDNSGYEKNFMLIGNYDGRRYLKVSTKGNDIGTYTLTLKKRFEVPKPQGKRSQDSYKINWSDIKNAKEYLITIFDEKGVIGKEVTDKTTYEYVFNNDTIGKTLAFTVTPRENEQIHGEASAKIFTSNASSEWEYSVPMSQARTNFSSAAYGKKIYVLGGEDKERDVVLKSLEVFDTEKQTWSHISDYPGEIDGICNATMLEVDGKLYVFGGQTGTGTSAKAISKVYSYNVKTNDWEKMSDMTEGRTGLVATVCEGKIYAFAKAGSTERIDIYDPKENQWRNHTIKADTSINIQAQTIDGRIFVLREKGKQMYWEEYIPETGEYDNEGDLCTIANADQYTSSTVVNGKVYMVNANITDRVLCYDVYQNIWSELSQLNLKKKDSKIQSVGENLYSIGGYANGFGTLDVMEIYELAKVTLNKTIEVKKNEIYELQVNAGDCEEDTDYTVTVRVDPKVLEISQVSSFMQKEEMENGKDGIKLISFKPQKGVMVFTLRGLMEQGNTYEAYQSIPVAGLKDATTVVEMQVEKK